MNVICVTYYNKTEITMSPCTSPVDRKRVRFESPAGSADDSVPSSAMPLNPTELPNPLPVASVRPGMLKTGRWRKVVRRTKQSKCLDERRQDNDRRKNHGPPRHTRDNLDICAAALRCLYVSLPLDRIAKGKRDRRAQDMEHFAAMYSAVIVDVVKREQADFSAWSLKNGLYMWLGLMATHGGNGKTIKLGNGPKDSRFGWPGFYIEDEAELWASVDGAVRRIETNDTA